MFCGSAVRFTDELLADSRIDFQASKFFAASPIGVNTNNIDVYLVLQLIQYLCTCENVPLLKMVFECWSACEVFSANSCGAFDANWTGFVILMWANHSPSAATPWCTGRLSRSQVGVEKMSLDLKLNVSIPNYYMRWKERHKSKGER